MPRVYLALANSGKPLPAFTQKKIGNRMPGPVGDVPISVFAGFVFFPVMAFRFLLACFSTNKTVNSTEGYFINIFKPFTSLAHLFDVPVASIRFNDLSKDQADSLRGIGMQCDLTNQHIFVGSPAIQHISQINALRPVDDRIRPGHVQFDGYLAWTYLIRGLHILSTVMNTMQTGSFYHHVFSKIAVNGGETGTVYTSDNQIVEEFVNTSETAVAQNTGQMTFFAPTADFSAYDGLFLDASSLTASIHGIFFPFFLGMSTPDKTIAYQVFSKIFAGSIATSQEASASLMSRIRSGVRQLAFSRSGMVMAHAYACVDIALQVPNSKIAIVLKGNVYCGMVVGGKFKVSLYGETVESGDVLPDIQAINLLETQAKQIVDWLNAVEDGMNSSVYSFTTDDFMTSRKALRSWNSIDKSLFHSSDALAAVEKTLGEMEFNDSFPIPTVKMVEHFLSFVATGDIGHINQYPAYLGSSILSNSSRVYEGLSIFGPNALSTSTGDKKGLNFQFPKPGKADPNLQVDPETGKRKLQYFPLCTVPVDIAARQWNLFFSTGLLSIVPPRKGKKEFTGPANKLTFKVADEPAFTDMYNQIRGIVNENRKAKAGSEGGKRKGGILSSGKKKSRVVANVEDGEI